MTVHVLVEVTAKPDRVEEVQEATQAFLSEIKTRETHAQSVQAFRLHGSRNVIVHLSFKDQLAAHDHRNAAHTTRFTQRIEPHAAHVDIHELEPLKPVSPDPE